MQLTVPLAGPRYDVGCCVIYISNRVEHLDKKGSYKNSTKEVVLFFGFNAINKILDKISFHNHKFVKIRSFMPAISS